MSKKNRKAVECKIWNALTIRPKLDSPIFDKHQCFEIIRQVLDQHRSTSFSAADIRIFLAENLPYYPRGGEDDFHYNVTAEDIERVSRELFKLFKANGDN